MWFVSCFVVHERDNLNFMNFKTDSFKICRNSWILGTFEIHKIRILNPCCPVVQRPWIDHESSALTTKPHLPSNNIMI